MLYFYPRHHVAKAAYTELCGVLVLVLVPVDNLTTVPPIPKITI